MDAINHLFLDQQSFGDAAFKAELLTLYASQLDELLPILSTAALADVQRIGHRLRGASLAVGADEMAALAASIEVIEGREALDALLATLGPVEARLRAALA